MGLYRIIYTLLIINIIKSSWSQRRIQNGKPLGTKPKPYAVYLVRSEKSSVHYTDWVCGGALVAKEFIVTAAACLEDVDFIYAIGGVKDVVQFEDLDTHKCTKSNKRKVIYTCVPKAYQFDYADIGKWSAIDIGIARIEKEFKFDKGHCDYDTAPIAINYDPKFQETGIDAIVIGWGHSEIWKQPGDEQRLLQKEPHYASVSITNKKQCKEAYKDISVLQDIIEKYMICTNGSGNLDDLGNIMTTLTPDAEGCPKSNSKGECRRSLNDNITAAEVQQNRRHGICQNDHGGPLVTWIGGREYLIGVASVFRVNNESKCEGPYLFTSTQCNGAFLNCILNSPARRRNPICDMPAKERGFEMIHRHISWANHPDGPAENEKVNYRPLIPLRSFNKRKRSKHYGS